MVLKSGSQTPWYVTEAVTNNKEGIKAYQKMLNGIGNYGLKEDGVWGGNTAKAVKDFQSKYGRQYGGLSANGVLSSKTKESIYNFYRYKTGGVRNAPITTSRKPTSLAPTTSNKLAIQNRYSYPGSSGGVKGTQTPSWVMGQVTGNTDRLRTIQDVLDKLGYTDKTGNRLKIDGIVGQRTQEALRKFQQQTGGLGVNGLLTQATKLKLYAALQQKSKYKGDTSPEDTTGEDQFADLRSMLGGDTGGGGGGDILNAVDPTISPWQQTPHSQLLSEATNAANSIYDPLIGGYKQAVLNKQGELVAGRQTILGQSAQREADLKAILDQMQQYMSTSQSAGAANQQAALDAISALNQSGQAAQQQTYEQMTGNLQNELNRMGVQAPAASAGLSQQQMIAQALLNSQSMSNQQSVNAQSQQSESLRNILNTGIVNNNQSNVAQSNIIRDRSLNELAASINSSISDLGLKLSGTESDKAAKLYEVLKSLESEDWKKYMDTSQILFDQQMGSANLGQNAAQIAASLSQNRFENELALKKLELDAASGGSDSTRLTKNENALNFLNNSGLSPALLDRYRYVLGVLQANTKTSGADITSPFGTVPSGSTYTSYMDPNRAAEYYTRAWRLIAPYVNSPQDDNWTIMQGAIDRLLGSKGVTPF
jgi:peptidoglycan hydrolase-like protein with peptidoglycan-binding domain